MVRLLHVADAHLGARHVQLGAAGTTQRERQVEAFAGALALAAREKVDLVLIAGDLFDSNTPSHRTLERVAAELRRLVDAGSRAVLIPGHSDAYEKASVYRSFDLAVLAGLPPGSDGITVLSSQRPEVSFEGLGVTVHGLVQSTPADAGSPLAGFQAPAARPERWNIGLAHAPLRTSGEEAESGAIGEEEIAATGLDYVALGHVHRLLQGRAGSTAWAYPGPPELVHVDTDAPGQVLLVELTESAASRNVRIQPWPIGRTRYLHLELDAAGIENQAALVEQLLAVADPDVACLASLSGTRSEGLVVDQAAIHELVDGAFLSLQLGDESTAPPVNGPLPPPRTIAGVFLSDAEARIASAEAENRLDDMEEAREILWSGARVLQDSPESGLLGGR